MMKRLYLGLTMATCLLACPTGFAASHKERGNLIFDNVPDAPTPDAARLEAYLGAREAIPLGWSPKGQLLIATRFGDVNQLHEVERPDGTRRQLTFGHDPIAWGAYSPDPARNAFVFEQDADGRECAQLYRQHSGDAAAKLLTDGRSRNGGALWSNTGRELAFFTTARNGSDVDIDIVEPETGVLPRLGVTGDAAAWRPLDWSPDDRKLLVSRTVSPTESYLYVVDLSSGQKHEVEPGPAKTRIVDAKFSRDGQGVYLISDRDADFTRLRYVNLFTGEKSVPSGSISGDVEGLAISRDGHYLAFISNENGAGRLNLQDLRTHQDLTPPRLPGPGVLGALSFDGEGKRLLFAFSSPNQPRDAYVLDVAANRVEAWTHSEAGPFDPAKFVSPRLTNFPTFDRLDNHQRQIPVYVYEPVGGAPHPVVLLFHSGPEAQFRPEFDPWIQYVVNELGYAVVAPNVRGSTGYGKAYAGLDNGAQREDVIKDLGSLIVWVGLQADFDARRVVVSGSGYGGYLALAALINYGDRLKGGIDFAGITDFISFLNTTASYRQDARRAEYGDEREPDMRAYLRRISPLTNADRILRPLLVVQGRNDVRVPSGEADQLVNRLRARGADVWFLQAGNEGHTLNRQADRDAYFTTFAQFLTTLR